MPSYDDIVAKFKVAKRYNNGNRIQAFCPAHDDKNASLSILLSDKKILLFCHAGCNVEDIVKSAGLTLSDLFLDTKPPSAIYQYRNADGSLSHEKLKYITEKGKRFKQRRIDEDDTLVDNLDNIRKIPYNYPQVSIAIKQDSPILYVEGEKDAESARLIGYTATTMGGASDWKDEYKNYFKKARIIQIPDNDKPGITLAQNVTKSLEQVCKSLKVIILPEGKDLTEWITRGNKDIKPLIDSSPELIKYGGLSEPKTETTHDGHIFYWDNIGLTIKVERLNDDAEGIIRVIDNERVIHTSKINLYSTVTLSQIAKRLLKSKNIDWDSILSQIAIYCTNYLKESGIEENINTTPITMKVEYLLEPLLPKNEPVTIYTAGGKGKSIFADYISVLVQFGIVPDSPLPFLPYKTNVLYLDWEADAETHRRYITAIKRGLKLSNIRLIDDVDIQKEKIIYKRIDHPLTQVIEQIRETVINNNVGLVIIDSQMAATASGTRGLTEAQVASEYYNLIRSLHCTTLTIDHITKQAMSSDNGTEAPYGSVVKYNRSRSQFELKLSDDDYEDADYKEYALIHRKYNLGRKQKPLGISIKFENNGNGELHSLVFDTCNIKENPSLSKTIPRVHRIREALKEMRGEAHYTDIAEAIGESENAKEINIQLANTKKYFVSLGNGNYGLVKSGENEPPIL